MIERRKVKDALRAAGLSSRQAQAILRGGWSALVGEADAERDELREVIADLTSKVECLATLGDTPSRPDLSATDGAGP
jgi:hypothetical protein